MEVRVQQVIYGLGELIATHNLMQYVRNNTEDEKIRMMAGAGMAGLGYVFGPELEDRMRNLDDVRLNESMKQNMMYGAAGAMAGALAGYALGPRLQPNAMPLPPGSDLHRAMLAVEEEKRKDRERPGGLITIASAGWLGYSLFFDGKTKEEQKRHLWGLGAGVIGYMYGPEVLSKTRDILIPRQAGEDVKELYAQGGAWVGGVAGGLFGLYKGADVAHWLSQSPKTLPGDGSRTIN